ncbi:nuclear transport factor 2 family protein [Streptacidiphilus albus]|uniref:nuclear transport factor 2 family protein n=1 Tax=Streptacidiphilus albus TaxID=105425 RepID=UPI00054C3ED9|nr:nuclear transport factor 2 family protein [Streptacidiphilus albus]
MTTIEETVQKYVASWSEPDPEIRRATVAELWSPDALYKNATTEYPGLKGIEEAVQEVWDLFTSKGFTVSVGRVDANHEAVRYTWELYAPGADTEPVALGTQVVTLDAAGRMVRDYQFVDKAPEGLID